MLMWQQYANDIAYEMLISTVTCSSEIQFDQKGTRDKSKSSYFARRTPAPPCHSREPRCQLLTPDTLYYAFVARQYSSGSLPSFSRPRRTK